MYRATGTFVLSSMMLGLMACGTADVVEQPDPPDLYPLSDAAFGEYLNFLEIPGITSSDEDGVVVWTIDTTLVDGVAELPLSKTSSATEELLEAGLATAEDKIVDLDGIQFFVNLQTLRITANDVEQLDVSALANLTALDMNFNLVGELDLTQNAELSRLRYQGSAQAEDGQRLSDIDLSGNPVLRHLYLPNHELVTIDLSNNPLIDEELDLSGNPGPDGDPDTPDIVVPAAIYDQVPEGTRLGVISDAEAGVLVGLLPPMPGTIAEAGGTTTITARLNTVADDDVTVTLAFGGQAMEIDDFTAAATEIVIPAGELTATTTLTGVDDDMAEGSETIDVAITEATNAQLGNNASVTVNIEDDEFVPPLFLNEVLYDPPSGDAGDANNDGTREPNEDEFIELVNVSGGPLDLGDYKVWDTTAWDDGVPRHVFPAGTVLQPDEVFVLFGGGAPMGPFGSAQFSATTTGRINLNNDGDVLRITDATDFVVLVFDLTPLSNNPDECYTRDPDLSGGGGGGDVGDETTPSPDWFQPEDISDTLPLFTPGTRNDGSPF